MNVKKQSKYLYSLKVLEYGQDNLIAKIFFRKAYTTECPKCHSSNIIISASTAEKKAARHSVIYWMVVAFHLVVSRNNPNVILENNSS